MRQRGLAVRALDLRGGRRRTFTSTMRQQRHRAAIRRAQVEAATCPRRGTVSAPAKRTLTGTSAVAAAELAQRRAAQRDADVLRHFLRAEAVRGRALAVDAHRASRCSASPMSTRTSRSSLRLASIGTMSSAELGQRLGGVADQVAPARSAGAAAAAGRRCRRSRSWRARDLGSSLRDHSSIGLGARRPVPSSKVRRVPRPALLAVPGRRSARSGSARGWRRGTSRRLATSSDICSSV